MCIVYRVYSPSDFPISEHSYGTYIQRFFAINCELNSISWLERVKLVIVFLDLMSSLSVLASLSPEVQRFVSFVQ